MLYPPLQNFSKPKLLYLLLFLPLGSPPGPYFVEDATPGPNATCTEGEANMSRNQKHSYEITTVANKK